MPIPTRSVSHAAIVLPALFSALPAAAQPTSEDAAIRGAYVASAAGCTSCHTSDPNEPFAGGRPLPTQFGKISVPNITPDPETGIGDYDFEDFERALRQGVRNDGAALYPAMPYVHFTKMTDADISDLWAFMQSIKPVENEVAESTLAFPYNVRSALSAWKALNFEPGRFEPDPELDDEGNRGAYIVEALTHCSFCHTPRTDTLAQDPDRYLKGAELTPWYAPNISNDATSALDDYTVDSLVAFLSEGHDGDGRTPYGRMAETVYDSTSHLDGADVRAVATYLKGRDAQPAMPVAQPLELSAEARERGESLYASNCVSCHGEDGAGAPGVGARLAGNASVSDGPPDNAISIMLSGMEPRGEWGAMPSFAESLSDEEIVDIANYIRTSWQNDATVLAEPIDVDGLRNWINPAAVGTDRAVLCPAVSTDAADTETRDAIAELDVEAAPELDVLRPIVEGHVRRHEDLSPSQRITTLTGLYCRNLAERADTGTSRLEQQLTFMDRVGDLVSGTD